MIDAAYTIRHATWATRRLLEYCATLPAEALELTLAGTAGPVRLQLAHLVSAESRYLFRITGHELPPVADDASVEQVLTALAGVERVWAAALEATIDLDQWVELGDGRVRRRVMVSQAVVHGVDHRTQVGAILLHHGYRIPNLDAWAYARTLGDGEYPDEEWIDTPV